MFVGPDMFAAYAGYPSAAPPAPGLGVQGSGHRVGKQWREPGSGRRKVAGLWAGLTGKEAKRARIDARIEKAVEERLAERSGSSQLVGGRSPSANLIRGDQALSMSEGLGNPQMIDTQGPGANPSRDQALAAASLPPRQGQGQAAENNGSAKIVDASDAFLNLFAGDSPRSPEPVHEGEDWDLNGNRPYIPPTNSPSGVAGAMRREIE